MKQKLIMFIGSISLCTAAWCQNVGIGTSLPSEKLTVATTTNSFGVVQTDGTVTVGTWVGNGGGYFGTRSAHPLRFFTANGTTQMTILTNGYVGIGTTTPSSPLSLQTPNNSDGFSHTSDGGIILKESVGGISAAIGTYTNHIFRLMANGNAAINIDPGGKVGIGNSDPAFLLDVADRVRIRSNGASTAGVGLNNPANTAMVAFVGIKQVDQVGFYGNVSGWGLTMNTNTGDVAAGNLNPVAGYKLSVGGGAYVNGTIYGTGDAQVNGFSQVGGNLAVTGSAAAHSFSTGGWNMSGAGNFFFISGGGMQMELYDGSIDVYSTSDRNAKKNIEPLPDVLSKVMKLAPSQYYYKTDTASSQLSTGFMAQDVQQLFPYAVHTKNDPNGTEMLSVAYRHFEVIAIKAIQEQQNIINQQQSEMDELKKRLTLLEKIVSNY